MKQIWELKMNAMRKNRIRRDENECDGNEPNMKRTKWAQWEKIEREE